MASSLDNHDTTCQNTTSDFRCITYAYTHHIVGYILIFSNFLFSFLFPVWGGHGWSHCEATGHAGQFFSSIMHDGLGYKFILALVHGITFIHLRVVWE